MTGKLVPVRLLYIVAVAQPVEPRVVSPEGVDSTSTGHPNTERTGMETALWITVGLAMAWAGERALEWAKPKGALCNCRLS